MISQSSYGSLSGTFRLSSKEYGAINYLRHTRKWNLAHIAETLGRSLATIHRVLEISNLSNIDNRGRKQVEARNLNTQFQQNLRIFKIQVKLWLDGYVDTIKDAMAEGVVSWTLVKQLLSENSADTEDEDPA